MPARLGVASWPGVQGMISCTYTASHGTAPGIATLEIPEQDVDRIAPFGDLAITDGVGGILLRRCRVQAVNFLTDGSRRIVLHIADRRWMWQYGAITAHWNAIDPYPDPDLFPPGEFTNVNGPFMPGTFRPAHLMMADCLDAMGERGYLITPAPVVPIPAEWNEENPSQALASLCDTLGYRICFSVNSDRVLIAPSGAGRSLPSGLPIISDSPSVNLPSRPSVIQLVGGDTIFNDLLALEPCGLEPSGQVRAINDLSYKPPGGWEACNPTSFWEVAATSELTQPEARDLAAKCIWRMFRVSMEDVVTGGAGPNVPGFGLVTDRKQIVLLPQSYGTTRQANGQPDTSPPYVIGKIYIVKGDRALEADRNIVIGNTDSTDGRRLPRTPVIDSSRGVVTFDRQLYTLTGLAPNRRWAAPDLWLHTGFTVRGIVGLKPTRFLRGGAVDVVDVGCPPEVIRHPELGLIFSVVRRDKDRSVSIVNSNLDQLIPAADYYLAQANAKYQAVAAQSRTYAGIYPIDLDGAVQQVTWRVGGGGPAVTTASLNSEHDRYIPNYPERRRNEQTIAFNSRDALDRAKTAKIVRTEMPPEATDVAPAPRELPVK